MLVTAFGPNPDGDGTLLRLWEQAGKDGPCRVRLPQELSQRDGPALQSPRPAGRRTVAGPRRATDPSAGPFAPASVILKNETSPK